MPGVCRLTDMSAGADGCCPISMCGATSGTILINGRPPAVMGDIWGAHPCGNPKYCSHVEVCISGVPNVLCGSRPTVIMFTPLAPGDMSCTGSANVRIGG